MYTDDKEDNIFDGKCNFIGVGPEGKEIFIDYYGLLDTGNQKVKIGDTVIFGFRSQTFATRCANTAVVRGIREGNYVLMGVYDHCCHRMQRWP